MLHEVEMHHREEQKSLWILSVQSNVTGDCRAVSATDPGSVEFPKYQ